jgi:hypothetical protein
VEKLTARASAETIAQISGIRFATNAVPETTAAGHLQEIQSKLSGGMDDTPPPTVSHLNFYAAAVVDGPDKTYISLWVPSEQQSQATGLLEAAGFTVVHP